MKISNRYASGRETCARIFSAGGEIEMLIDESSDGTYFTMFRDKFGIEWMIKFDPCNKG